MAKNDPELEKKVGRILAVIVVGAGIAWWKWSTPDQANASEAYARAAFVTSCHRAVSDKLVSPSSALFDSTDTSSVQGTPGKLALGSAVTSKNAFGVEMRAKFTCVQGGTGLAVELAE